MDSEKIRLSVAEVILHAAGGNLARSKKQHNWTPINSFLLLPFLMEAEIIDGETTAEELFKIFARSITEISEEGEDDDEEENDKYSEEDEEAE